MPRCPASQRHMSAKAVSRNVSVPKSGARVGKKRGLHDIFSTLNRMVHTHKEDIALQERKESSWTSLFSLEIDSEETQEEADSEPEDWTAMDSGLVNHSQEADGKQGQKRKIIVDAKVSGVGEAPVTKTEAESEGKGVKGRKKTGMRVRKVVLPPTQIIQENQLSGGVNHVTKQLNSPRLQPTGFVAKSDQVKGGSLNAPISLDSDDEGEGGAQQIHSFQENKGVQVAPINVRPQRRPPLGNITNSAVKVPNSIKKGEEPSHLQGQPPILPPNKEVHRAALLAKLSDDYNELLERYDKLQAGRFEEFESVFALQRERVEHYSEAAKNMVTLYKMQVEEVTAHLEKEGFLKLQRKCREIEQINCSLVVAFDEQSARVCELEAHCEELRERERELTAALESAQREIGNLTMGGRQPRMDQKCVSQGLDLSPSVVMGGASPFGSGSVVTNGNTMRATLQENVLAAEIRHNGDSAETSQLMEDLAYSKVLNPEAKESTERECMGGEGARVQVKGAVMQEEKELNFIQRDGKEGGWQTEGTPEEEGDEEEEEKEEKVERGLIEWREWLSAFPGILTSYNGPTTLFKHEPSGFAFELGPVPKVEVECSPDGPPERASLTGLTEVEADEIYYHTIALGKAATCASADLPGWVVDDEDGICFSPKEAPKFFSKLEALFSTAF